MLDDGGRVLDLDVREGVRAAAVAHEHGVALGVVSGALRAGVDLDQSAVRVLAVAGGDSLRDDRGLGPLANVDHLGAGIRLLLVGSEGY